MGSELKANTREKFKQRELIEAEEKSKDGLMEVRKMNK
jgi:hypothetical protein